MGLGITAGLLVFSQTSFAVSAPIQVEKIVFVSNAGNNNACPTINPILFKYSPSDNSVSIVKSAQFKEIRSVGRFKPDPGKIGHYADMLWGNGSSLTLFGQFISDGNGSSGKYLLLTPNSIDCTGTFTITRKS